MATLRSKSKFRGKAHSSLRWYRFPLISFTNQLHFKRVAVTVDVSLRGLLQSKLNRLEPPHWVNYRRGFSQRGLSPRELHLKWKSPWWEQPLQKRLFKEAFSNIDYSNYSRARHHVNSVGLWSPRKVYQTNSLLVWILRRTSHLFQSWPFLISSLRCQQHGSSIVTLKNSNQSDQTR